MGLPPIQILLLSLLALVPPALLIAAQNSTGKWLLIGLLCWTGAVAIKASVGILVAKFSEKAFTSKRIQSTIWGLWSSFCELGATVAVILFFKPFPGLLEAIALGTGAGAFEVLFVLGAIYFESRGKKEDSNTAPPGNAFLRWSTVFERIFALIGHVGTRGLIWVSLVSGNPLPTLLAVITFSIVDGLATYGIAMKWDWKDPRICLRFQGFVAFLSIVELALFLLLAIRD